MKFQKSNDLVFLSYPSFIICVGVLFFYSQMAFDWWQPHSTIATFFAIFNFLILLMGFVIFAGIFSSNLGAVKKEMKELGLNSRFIGLCLLVLVGFVLLGLFSALKPAHRFTEGDFLEYHLYIPKQNWLRGSWNPIDWHVSEFLALTIDYALSAFWISLPMLNRLPQYLIECFLMIKILNVFRFLK